MNVKVKTTLDLVSAIPYLLGYQPQESVTVVCVRKGGALGLIARSDLDPLTDATIRAECAYLIAERAADDATHFAIVATHSKTSHAEVAAAFAAALSGQGINTETWHVGPENYESLDCAADSCRGSAADLGASPVAAALVVEGVAPATTRTKAYALPATTASQRERASAARWSHKTVGESLAPWHKAVAGQANPEVYGQIAAAASSNKLRDQIIAWCLDVNEPGDAMTAILTANVAPGPSAATGTEILEQVAAHCPDQADALAVLALLAWWQGDGGKANTRCQAALAVEPKHRLAQLIEATLATGLPPAWIAGR